MRKLAITILPMVVLAAIGLTSAQSTPTKPLVKSDTSSHPAPIKPLTPKSAMPAPHKAAAGVPKVTAAGANNSAELARLEQQNKKAPAAKNTSTQQRSVSSAPKSAATNPAINFQYEKPNTNTSVKKN